jgi:aminoglycoside 2'-N-acetyltransferase I
VAHATGAVRLVSRRAHGHCCDGDDRTGAQWPAAASRAKRSRPSVTLGTRGAIARDAPSRARAATIAPMTEVRTAHAADLDAGTLRAARALLDAVFEGDLTDHDWEHALGGVHALVWEENELIGHASVVQRRLLHGGRALRAGYVEGVGVSARRRGRGHAAAMTAALERVVRGAYDVGALGATDEAAGFYAARGWRQWEGPTSALTPAGIARTEADDGGIYVLPVAVALDLSGALACDWRDGDAW